MSLSYLLDFPLPGLVHVNVSTWTLQQLLLCCSSSGHCHGCQNPAHHPVFCYSQWETGEPAAALMSPETEAGTHDSCVCSLQLMMTVGLLAVVVYLYTVVAFNFFRKFYNKSEDEDEPDMKCDDMMTVSAAQMVQGLVCSIGGGGRVLSPRGQ